MEHAPARAALGNSPRMTPPKGVAAASQHARRDFSRSTGKASSQSSSSYAQDETHAFSLKDPEAFWSQHAQQLEWHTPPSHMLKRGSRTSKDGTAYPHWTWFPDGEISTTHNCLDRHVANGNGGNAAIIWDSPVTNTKQTITYKQLLEEVEAFAAVLRDQGVKKGDVVIVYMPMIPPALIAILAIARLGAIHAVVFGGFAAASLAQRIDASKPKAIVTASCGIEGSKPPVPYQSFVQGAVEKSAHKPASTIIWQRPQLKWDKLQHDKGERDWETLVKEAKRKGRRVECVPVKSDDPLYIIYTSGTTGLPKGVLREAGGHAVNLNMTTRYMFGIRGPGDVLFTASDIGWVVGHSYILYGPLLAGATTVLFEGKPIGNPDAGTFWRIISEYKVNALFTAPTALRAVRQDDPDHKLFKQYGESGSLRQLRALFVAGERSEPSIVQAYQKLLDRYAAPGAQVIDNWWTSEAGSPKTAIALLPKTGMEFSDTSSSDIPDVKPGSAGKLMPGWDVRCVDDDGNEVKAGSMGNIVLAAPLAPSGFVTLFNDEPRFYKGYFARFQGKWLDTGDAGLIDEQGYVHIMSRSDDVINVAAHRFSTGAIEQVIASHPDISECCTVGIPDRMKGQLPFAFVTLSTADHPTDVVPSDKLVKEVQQRVREQIGSVAALGGIIQGKGMIPKTRSGKTLRRVLRELLENAVHGDFEKEVSVPPTVEDASIVDVARAQIKKYFEQSGGRHQAIEARPKL